MRIIKSFQIISLSITFIFANTLSVPTNAIAVVTPPLTKCNKPMHDLVLTVEIYKIGFFRDQKVADEKEIEQGLIFTNKVIKNEKTYFKCKNTKLSKYYGIAFATATIGGKFVKTFHVITEKTIPLKCGN